MLFNVGFVFLVNLVCLLVALYLIRKFIKENELSENGNINNRLIVMHIVTNLLQYTALFLLFSSLVRESNPYQTCPQMLQHTKQTPIALVIYELLSFVSQCFIYTICYKYAQAAELMNQKSLDTIIQSHSEQ